MIVENKLRSIVSYLAILAVFCVPVLDIFRLWENPEASRKITGILTIPVGIGVLFDEHLSKGSVVSLKSSGCIYR